MASACLSCFSAALTIAADYDTPKGSFFRQNEDWSSLKSVPAAERRPEHKFKYFALNESQSIWMSIGGHYRARTESWDNFAFGAPDTNDDTFTVQRATLHADLHLGSNFRVFVEGKHAEIDDRQLPGNARPLDRDRKELQQAFVDLSVPIDGGNATLRVGRQQLMFGKQRLISALPWGNALRHWDAVQLIVDKGQWHTNLFASEFVPVQQEEKNSADEGNTLNGVYTTRKLNDDSGFDLYALGIKRVNRNFNGSIGDEDRYTLGGRYFGKSNAIDYEIELAYQFGDINGADISAYMFTGVVGRKFVDGPGKPRLSIGFDYATGDDDAGGDVETFNQLFPLGHAYLGYTDVVGRQNIMDIYPGVSFTLGSRFNFAATAHFFQRVSDNDALYSPGGGVVRAPLQDASSDVGSAIDLTLKFKIDRGFGFLFGYSQFFAGDFIEQTGASDDIRLFYGQVAYTF